LQNAPSFDETLGPKPKRIIGEETSFLANLPKAMASKYCNIPLPNSATGFSTKPARHYGQGGALTRMTGEEYGHMPGIGARFTLETGFCGARFFLSMKFVPCYDFQLTFS
jgi:hypothetical protein